MKKPGLLKYLFLLFDFLSALFSWSAFYYFRKTQIEHVPFEFSERFYLGLLIIPSLWVIAYWLFGSYDNVYRKYRMQVFYKTIVSSFLGTLAVFFIFIFYDFFMLFNLRYLNFARLFFLFVFPFLSFFCKFNFNI